MSAQSLTSVRATTAELPSVGMVSTYPPTVCGLATFTAALERALVGHGVRVEVVRAVESDAERGSGPTLVAGSFASLRRAADTLARHDVAIIQHEYGIYGGPDGEEVLDLLERLVVPAIVVLHTVPASPTPRQAEILIALCRLADKVVVMTESARSRLMRSYVPIDGAKVATISHGALLATAQPTPLTAGPQLLTWGLLGRGKGIERVLASVADLARAGKAVRYTVAGVTHPKVRARDGDAYRNSLIERAHREGISHLVTFDDSYREVDQLTQFIASASVVVLPYDTKDQVTSGVLVDSIAAGRPVIATAFPHAQELLSNGAGIVVPHDDPDAMTRAISALTTDPSLLRDLTRAAHALAPSLSWQAIAYQYLRECWRVLRVEQTSTV